MKMPCKAHIKYGIYVIGLLLVYAHASSVSTIERKSFLCSYTGKKIFLLSYPRSGNTLMRYCLEFLTQRASFYRWSSLNMDRPIADTTGFPIDTTKRPIEKVHRKREMVGFTNEDCLIFLLRDPIETLVREIGSDNFLMLIKGVKPPAPIFSHYSLYFDNLKIFSEWKEENKILVYYEDFLREPRKTLQRVLTFLGDSDEKLDELMERFDEHKKRALEVYNMSESQGKDLHYHAKKLTLEEREEIQGFIQEKYKDLWHLFLERYDISNNVI